MPASFSPAPPNSMASLSIEEGAAPSPAALDTATTTVPVISADKKDDSELGAGSSSRMGGTDGEKDGEKDGKKKKNRCLFCSIHRYSDKHECGFDYKALGAEEISKSNPV